jgi:gliding motility-associated-like protein
MFISENRNHITLRILLIAIVVAGSCITHAQLTGCHDTSYNIRFTFNKTFGFADQLTARNGEQVFAGGLYADLTYTRQHALIKRLDAQGNLLWSKQLSHTSDTARVIFTRIKELSDGGFFCSGRSFNNADTLEHLLVAKFDAGGNLVWHHSYKLTHLRNADMLIREQQITEDINGDIYFAFNPVSPGYSVITRMNASGAIVWSKGFVPGTGVFAPVLNGLFIRNNTINIIGVWNGFITMQLDKSSGTMLAINHYALAPGISASPDPQEITKTFELNNGDYILCAKSILSGDAAVQGFRYLLVRFDAALSPKESFTIKAFPQTNGINSDLICNKEGEINYCFARYSTNRVYYGTINTNYELVQQKKLLLNYSQYVTARSMLNTDSGGRVLLNPIFAVPPADFGIDAYYLNAANKLDNSCLQDTDTSFTQLEDFSMVLTPFAWDHIDNNALTEQALQVNVSPVVFTRQEICRQVSTCDYLDLQGPDSVCVYNNNVVYTVFKGAGCLRKVNWLIDTSAIHSMTTINDTTISIRYKRPWNGYLYASFQNCTLIDSIRIKVYEGQPQQLLGADTSFCEGDSLALTIMPVYSSYAWNTGAVTPSIKVKTAGLYDIKAYYADGCYATDTLEVLPLSPTPVISLPSTNNLCIGQSDTLKPGDGYSRYKWQDGSQLPVFVVRNPGVFWVQVTNTQGCIANDTAHIVALRPTPTNFIATDTSFCRNWHITLEPRLLFTNYLWSTGSTSRSINVSTPGFYSLKVTDVYGCYAQAGTVVKEKDCVNKVLFPSGFTPNNDGRNDSYKPYVEGAIVDYTVVIYNRWGQVVFKSSTPGHGWNGQFNGKWQDTGTFIWSCKYKFFGETEVQAKGTMTLIR